MLQEKDVPKPQIKIIDFGLAQKLEDGVIFKSLCGTPQYIGMELLAGLGGQWDPWRPSCKGADESWDSFTGRGTCVMGTYWGTHVVVPPDMPPRSAFTPSSRSDQLRTTELRHRHVVRRGLRGTHGATVGTPGGQP